MTAKANTKHIDLVLKGPIWKGTLVLALPLIISQVAQFFYHVLDTIFVSRIDLASTAIISGTGIIFPLFFLAMSVSMGLMTGVSALISRGIGEDNPEVINKAADTGLMIAFVLAILLTAASFLFADSLIYFLAGTKLSTEAIAYGLDYFYYLIPGLAIMMINAPLYGILQGEGLAKYIAMSMMISTVVNLILDPILIFTFGMGVKGAGLATSLAVVVSFLFIVSVFVRNKSTIPIKWNIFLAESKLVKEIIRIGFPQSVGMISLAMTFMILNHIISSIGEGAMNSWTLCGRTDHLMMLPAFAISGATMTMIGQNYGKNQLDRVRQVYKQNILFAVALSLLFAVIYILIAPFLFSLLSGVPAVVSGSVLQVRITAITFAGVSVAIISSSAFQATGKPIPALILTFLRMGAIYIPVALILVKVYHLGVLGVFFAIAAGNLFALVASYLWTNAHLKNLLFEEVA